MRILLRFHCWRSLLHDPTAQNHGKRSCGSKARIGAVTGCLSLERRCILNSFIPWVGGKGKLLWIINKMAPYHYRRFIDVFGGSGTVTMNRPICILRLNEISSPAHMMSWLLVKRESAFLTWRQKLRISSAQKIQHSNAVHSTHGIFSFGATSLTWRCYFKSLLRMKTMDTFQRIYSKGCLSGFKTKSRFFDRPSRTS